MILSLLLFLSPEIRQQFGTPIVADIFGSIAAIGGLLMLGMLVLTWRELSWGERTKVFLLYVIFF